MGDPIELRLHGYELTLRKDDAAKITVHHVTDTDGTGKHANYERAVAHPGLGEGGKSVSYTHLDVYKRQV